jgi:PAS domain S-box-containing protein
MDPFDRNGHRPLDAGFSFEGMSLPVLCVDKGGQVIVWNECLAQSSGLESKHAEGAFLVDLLEPGDVQIWQEALHVCLLTKPMVQCNLRLRSGRNDMVGFHARVARHFNSDNEVTGAVCFLEQIDVKEADDPIEPRNIDNVSQPSALASFIQTASIPAFAVDKRGTIVLWNEALAFMSGYSSAESTGKSLVDTYVSGPKRDIFNEILNKALAGEGTTSHEFEFRTKGDDTRPVLLNVSPLEASTGLIIGSFAIAVDAMDTLHKYLSSYAKANELQRLIHTANTLIIGVDERGRVNLWSDTASDITGVSYGQAFDKPFIETFVAQSNVENLERIQNDATLGKGWTSLDLFLRTTDGGIRRTLVSVTPRRNADDAIFGVLYIAHDLTEPSKYDRAAASTAGEFRSIINTLSAPIFGIDSKG